MVPRTALSTSSTSKKPVMVLIEGLAMSLEVKCSQGYAFPTPSEVWQVELEISIRLFSATFSRQFTWSPHRCPNKSGWSPRA